MLWINFIKLLAIKSKIFPRKCPTHHINFEYIQVDDPGSNNSEVAPHNLSIFIQFPIDFKITLKILMHLKIMICFKISIIPITLEINFISENVPNYVIT